MRTLDDLLAVGVAGRRVLVRSDLNVPLDADGADHRRRPDPGVHAGADQAAQPRRAGDRHRAPGSSEGRARGEVLAAPGRRPHRAAARSARSTSPWTRSVRVPGCWPTRSRTASCCCWRTSGSTPGRRPRTTPSAREFAAALALLTGGEDEGGAYVDDAFGAVHRKHASVYDVATLLPHYGGDLVRTEVAVLRRLTGSPGAAVRGRARRQQGQRQAGRHRRAAADGRQAAGRRRDVLHVPGGAGPRGRRLAAGERSDRLLPLAAGQQRRQDRAADRHRRGRRVQRRREHPDRGRVERSRRAGRAWTSARSRSRCSPAH